MGKIQHLDGLGEYSAEGTYRFRKYSVVDGFYLERIFLLNGFVLGRIINNIEQ
jgi:hypothetical protein